jgi:acylphosphatase
MSEKMENKQKMVRVHIWVRGRVQAVGFRAFVQQNALQIGVTGWVRNVGYDTVEALAEGTLLQIEGFLAMVKRGPTASRVDKSREEWEKVSGEFTSFSVQSSR